VDKKYPDVRGKRFVTKFGQTNLLIV